MYRVALFPSGSSPSVSTFPPGKVHLTRTQQLIRRQRNIPQLRVREQLALHEIDIRLRILHTPLRNGVLRLKGIPTGVVNSFESFQSRNPVHRGRLLPNQTVFIFK
jgi:hypothetical protein